MNCRTVALICCFVLTDVAAIGTERSITPCDLVPPSHEGQRISIVSRLLFTVHGAYLLEDHCRGRGRHEAALVFPGDKGAPTVSFELDPSAIPRLQPFFRTTGGQAIACATISGQVFYKRRFHLRHFGHISIGNGFGENGRLRTAFVLQSVDEIHNCN